MKELNFKQKTILSLLAAGNSKKMSPIQIMKALFLFAQTKKPDDFYKFKPYLYGPCSFEVYSDLKDLTSKGYITTYPSYHNWSFYRITLFGKKKIKKEGKLKKDLESIKKLVVSKSFLELLQYIYSKYPKFAKDSIINKDYLEKL